MSSRRDVRVPTAVGVGNPLLGDEGVGVRAVELLRPRVPPGVRVLDRNVLGLDLLADVEEASRLLVLDCIDAGLRAGTVLRLDPSRVPRRPRPRLSPHEVSLPDLLALAALHDRGPDEVVVMGIQPARIRPGTDLSPEVAASLPRLVEEAVLVVSGWVAVYPGGARPPAGRTPRRSAHGP